MQCALPHSWYINLNREESVRSRVNINKNQLRWRKSLYGNDSLSNKVFYNVLIAEKFDKPIGINTWIRVLGLTESPSIRNFFFVEKIKENKLKVFRWKLINYIIPTKALLYKWKNSHNDRCNLCDIKEDYDHFFISCNLLKKFWEKINEILTEVKYHLNITLKHLVFGYKISDDSYQDLNYFFTILSFSIYKSYYGSEQKQKHVDVFMIFFAELRRSLYEIKLSENSLFFTNVKNYIQNNI